MRLGDASVDLLRDAVRSPDLTGTRYRLVRRVGQGGMGAVYEAEDIVLGRRLALKIVDLPEPDGENAGRLLEEARVLARLEHPGLVPVHDAGTLPDGRTFYAMKLVDGARLDEYLAGVPSVPERLRIFLRVCEPVAFAHARGVLHRDLKPSNVMVGPFGEVLVMDWGLARGVHAPEDAAAAGTPGFMAPEQARGGSVDVRADVYGLGALLAAMLEVRPAPPVPKPLLGILEKARALDPTARYAGVEELAADVRRFLDGERVLAHPEHPLEKAGRVLRKHRVAVLLILAYLAARGLMLLVPR